MKHLIFIVAYNHEKFINQVLDRLPDSIKKENYEILVADDASEDKTFKIAQEWKKQNKHIDIHLIP